MVVMSTVGTCFEPNKAVTRAAAALGSLTACREEARCRKQLQDLKVTSVHYDIQYCHFAQYRTNTKPVSDCASLL